MYGGFWCETIGKCYGTMVWVRPLLDPPLLPPSPTTQIYDPRDRSSINTWVFPLCLISVLHYVSQDCPTGGLSSSPQRVSPTQLPLPPVAPATVAGFFGLFLPPLISTSWPRSWGWAGQHKEGAGVPMQCTCQEKELGCKKGNQAACTAGRWHVQLGEGASHATWSWGCPHGANPGQGWGKGCSPIHLGQASHVACGP